MSRNVVEKVICEKCGVDVRENTLFCYNCGSPVNEPEPDPVEKPEVELEPADEKKSKAKAALDDLAKRIKIEPPTDEEKKLALAAAERKKARNMPRKPRDITWEPIEDAPDRILLLISVLVTVIAGAVVVMTVFWK